MNCKFWGVRGSIPTPISTEEIVQKTKKALMGAMYAELDSEEAIDEYLKMLPAYEIGTVGGNTSCVELQVEGNLFIFDAGSGLRPLGLSLMAKEFSRGAGTAHIFLGHTHWDHIMGIPFFVPGYIPGNTINIYGCHDRLEERIRYQQAEDHFPVSLDNMTADFLFHELQPGSFTEISGVSVLPSVMNHPGGSFGYRVESNNRAFVYASDTEFLDMEEEHTRFLHDADVLILDTMYTFDDVIAKSDWGHCTPMIGVDLALREEISKLVMFHHEPTYNDPKLIKLWNQTVDYKQKMAPDSDLEIILAYEGLEINM